VSRADYTADVFADRAVTPDVAAARGYRRYGIADKQTVAEVDARLLHTPSDPGWLDRVLTAPGLAMPRPALVPADPAFPTPYAQLRPDWPVNAKPRGHNHKGFRHRKFDDPELKQDAGKLDEAIEVVEQLDPSTYAAVSLAELYAQTGRWDDVIELTEGVKNEDDAAALLCVFRGKAFREQGFHDAAHEALKEALRSRCRAAEIRHLALAERAQNYLAQGKKSQARKDLERILADDSGYEGVREQLAALDD
jgi:tetratricopeptide (TPR) repeat protein